jgi:hypothetical protein
MRSQICKSGLNIMIAVKKKKKKQFFWPMYDEPIDITQYRLLFGFFLPYTDRAPFELLDSGALLYEGESCGGANSTGISKFGHHNINGRRCCRQYMTSHR